MVRVKVAKKKTNTLQISFKIENFAFAALVNYAGLIYSLPIIYTLKTEEKNNIFLYENIFRNIFFHEELICDLGKEISKLSFILTVHQKFNSESFFPARNINIKFVRSENEFEQILATKSYASRKRETRQCFFLNHKPYQIQNVSFEIFSNGNCLISGAQTVDDLQRIYTLWNTIFNFLLNYSTLKRVIRI